MSKTAVLRVDIIADASNASKGLSEAGGHLDDLGKAADKAGRKVADAGGHADDMSERFGDANSKSSQLAGGIGDLGGALAQAGGPVGALGSGMELLGPSIMGVAGATDLLELATGALSLTNIKAAASTAASTVATAANTVATKAAELASKAWAAAQWLLNAAMEANPLLLVITGVVALGAALVLAYKKSETFRNIVTAVFNAVAAAGKWLWNTILKPYFTLIKAEFGVVAAVLSAVWTKIIKPLLTTIGTVFRTVFSGVQTAIGWVSSAISTAWTDVKSFGGKILGFITGLPGKIKDIGGDMLNAGKEIIGAMFDGMKKALTAVGGFASDVATSIWNAVVGFINRFLIDPIKNFHVSISLGPFSHKFKPFGSLPEIPKLASGGVVDAATLALIGEGRHREVVAPEPMLRALIREEIAAGGVNITVTGALDPDAVARQIDSLLTRRHRRNGGVA